MGDIDLMDLRMSSEMWEKQGLVPMGKSIEHTSMYGTDLSDDENEESMMRTRMFEYLPADSEVITQDVSKIHEEFSKFFYAGRGSNRIVPSAVPKARKKILRMMKLGARESVNKLSVLIHRDWTFTILSTAKGIQDASDRRDQ